ncbi:anaerobic sulfatase-maturation protein [Dysgonomonas sp. 216]|uniref:anaerobic sulfatase-maturation protein n=1 Tax=Dysgonomonas sp. 216 TaxID=2302934 RepID=UPI0013D8C9BF|nr:anaerobic sulfatase-maturation protein [Dysgonomonas sp. 216]NDW19813.1 anaerobic sulfatase-maturation protein [Dysgonomonas sp. 216]
MPNNSFAPFAKPLYVMLKPMGAVCNLCCDYCYYLDKKNLYPNNNRYLMSDEILERFIKDYLDSQTMSQVLFTWHGGEPLMRNLAFYKKALDLQQKYAKGRRVDNVVQTNGTLLTDEWCKFLRDNNFLVGISIDGPQHCHDKYRKGVNKESSFHEVMKGLSLLQKYDVEYNAMAVVNNYNVNYPLEFYNFLKSIGCQYIQFTPIVEQIEGKPAPWNVPADKWGDFLITIFDEWVRYDVGLYYIQYFDSTLANWMGMAPGVCTLAKHCGHAGVIEFNGDVYSCDHFVFPQHKLGNLKTDSLTSMMYSEKQMKFGKDKYTTLPRQCKECDVLFACNGECPKNRIIASENGDTGLNYLCEGYYKFYKYIAPYMDFMKNELINNRPAANIMYALRKGNLML